MAAVIRTRCISLEKFYEPSGPGRCTSDSLICENADSISSRPINERVNAIFALLSYEIRYVKIVQIAC